MPHVELSRPSQDRAGTGHPGPELCERGGLEVFQGNPGSFAFARCPHRFDFDYAFLSLWVVGCSSSRRVPWGRHMCRRLKPAQQPNYNPTQDSATLRPGLTAQPPSGLGRFLYSTDAAEKKSKPGAPLIRGFRMSGCSKENAASRLFSDVARTNGLYK